MASEAHDALWWEGPRDEQEEGKQGRYAKVKGRDAKILCPKCQKDYVVYNGNYFCDSWVHRKDERTKLVEGECDWALPHPATKASDKEICDLIGIDYY